MNNRVQDTLEEYRLQGATAYHAGKSYTDCPYLPFPDCAEGMAWKNGWLAAKELVKLKGKP